MVVGNVCLTEPRPQALSVTIRPARSSAWKHLPDRKSTRLNSSHADIYTLSLHDAVPIYLKPHGCRQCVPYGAKASGFVSNDTSRTVVGLEAFARSEEHTSELQSRRYLHSFPTRRCSDLPEAAWL